MGFLGVDDPYKDSEFVILPIEYGSHWSNGTDRGPAAIIEASRHIDLYDLELDISPVKAGIYTKSNDFGLCNCVNNLGLRLRESLSEYISDNKTVIAIGGSHVMSSAILETFADIQDLSILVLDGHLDMRQSGEARTAVARMQQLSDDVVLVGPRSWSHDEIQHAKKCGQWDRTISMDYIRQNPQSGVIGRWADMIMKKLRHDSVYVSIDLDVLDISLMPTVSSPEPNGLLWDELIALLRRVAKNKNIIGFDVCNLRPVDGSSAYDSLAAKLVYKLIGYVGINKNTLKPKLV